MALFDVSGIILNCYFEVFLGDSFGVLPKSDEK